MILKHIIKNIWENKFRSILIIIALTLSAMVLFLDLGFRDDMSARYNSLMKESFQNYDFAVTKDTAGETAPNVYFDAASLDVSGLPVQGELDKLNAYGLMDTKDGGVTAVILGVDRAALIDHNLCILANQAGFDAADKTQIIINQTTAKNYNLATGDKMTITTAWGDETFTVGAIAEDRGLYQSAGDTVQLLVSKEYLEQKMHQAGMSDSIWVDLKSGSDVAAAAQTFNTQNPGYKATALFDQKAIDSSIASFNQILLLILFMVAILNFYVVSSITKLILAVRIPVVGTFRSVGATKNRVNGILFLENSLYGLIGGLLGVGFGLLVRSTVINIFIGPSGMTNTGETAGINGFYILAVLAFSVLLQIAITAKAILKVGKMPIKDTIFNVQNVKQNLSKKKTIIGVILLAGSLVCHLENGSYNPLIAGLGFALAVAGAVYMIPFFTRLLSGGLAFISSKLCGSAAALGSRNISYSKSITSNVVLTTVALSIMLSLYMMTLSIGTLYDKAALLFDYDIQISSITKPYTEYEKLASVKGVDKVDYLFLIYEPFDLGSQESPMLLVGLDKATMGIVDKGNKIPTLKDGEVLLDDAFARKNNLQVGDQIQQKDRNLTLTVVGFINGSRFTSNRTIGVVGKSYFIKNVTNVPFNIQITTNANVDAMKETIKKSLADENTTIQTATQYLDAQQKGVGGILNMTFVIMGISILLVVVGLVNNQMIGFIQRKKEYVVLYSVSMSRTQLRIMMLFEVMGTFIIGITLGTLLSVWLKSLLSDLLDSINQFIPMEFNYASIFGAVALVFVLLLLTALSPMKRLSKMNVVNEIKYE